MNGENLFKDISFQDEDGLFDISDLTGAEDKKDVVVDDATEINLKKPDKDDEFIDIDDNLEIETSTEGSSAGSQTSSPFSSLANALVARGHLPSDEEILKKLFETKDPEEFLEIYEEHRIDTLESSLTEEQLKFVEALKNGVPEDEAKSLVSSIKELNDIPEDKLVEQGVAEYILGNYYKLIKGNSDIEASTLVSSILNRTDINKVKVIDTARKAIQEHLKGMLEEKIGKKKEDKKNTIESDKKNVDELKKFVFEKELFPNIRLSDQMKQRVINTATKIVGESKEGKPLNAVMKAYEDNPIETLSKLSYVWEMTNGLKNLAGFNAKGLTAATNAVKQISEKPILSGAYQHSPAMREKVKSTGEELVSGLRAALGL